MEKQGMNDRNLSMINYWLNTMHEDEETLIEPYTQGYMAGYRAAIASIFTDYREMIVDIQNGAE